MNQTQKQQTAAFNIHFTPATTVLHKPTKGGSMNISKFKKTAACIMFVFAIQMIMIPAQNLYAGCTESATKAAVTASIAALGLVALDCLVLGCLVTATTVGTGGAALGAAALKVAAGAGAYGCVDATLWDKPSRPSPQPSH